MVRKSVPLEFAVLLVLLCAEVLSIGILPTYPDLSTAMFCIGSLLSGIILTVYGQEISQNLRFSRTSVFQKLVFAAAGLILLNWMLNIFRVSYSSPISISYADMLPMIEVMCDRYLSGREVYDIAPEIFNQSPPYLPAMWMPYLLPVSQKWDMRWTNIVLLIASIGIFLYFVSRANAPFLLKTIMFLLAAAIIEILVSFKFGYVLHTEEAVVLFYYTAFAVSLYFFNPYAMGVSAALCMLSRYSLLFWFIAFVIYLLFKREQRAFLVKFVVTGLVTGVLLMVVSSSMDDIPHLLAVPSQYLKLFESRNTYEEFIDAIQKLIGVRKYTMDIPFKTFVNASMAINIILPVVFFAAFSRVKKLNQWHLLGSAQVCLSVFLLLVVCPYTYLFYTPVVFSLISAALLLRNTDTAQQQIPLKEPDTE